MTKRGFAHILSHYGQRVTVYTQAIPKGKELYAFFQPMRDNRTEQTVPSPLGQVKQDRFVYIGPPEVALDDTCRLAFQDEVYRVESVHPIHLGPTLAYWQATLTHKAKETIG